jgi:hypothetical protein
MKSKRGCERTANILLLALISLIFSTAQAQTDSSRPSSVNGHPNFNGVWQAVNTAYWNLEAHSAEALPGLWQLGALAGIPAGQSFVVEGKIPYLPEALAKKTENKAGWPAFDPMVSCFMPGIPRATYMPFPFRIVQSETDVYFAYSFATANRIINMENHTQAPVDMWMGWSNGSWDGDTLVIEVNSNDDRTWLDRAGNYHSYQMKVTERYSLLSENIIQYEATIEDPLTFSDSWTIRMPLYRMVESNVALLDYNCVEFAEELLYGEFEKKE